MKNELGLKIIVSEVKTTKPFVTVYLSCITHNPAFGEYENALGYITCRKCHKTSRIKYEFSGLGVSEIIREYIKNNISDILIGCDIQNLI